MINRLLIIFCVMMVFTVSASISCIGCSSDKTDTETDVKSVADMTIDELIQNLGVRSASNICENSYDEIHQRGGTREILQALRPVADSGEFSSQRLYSLLLLFRFGDDRDARFEALFEQPESWPPPYMLWLCRDEIIRDADRNYVPYLIDRFNNSDLNTRSYIVLALANFADSPDVLSVIINSLPVMPYTKSDYDFYLYCRIQALGWAGRNNQLLNGDQEIVDNLLKLINHPDLRARQEACAALGYHGNNPASLVALRDIIESGDCDIVLRSLKSLAIASKPEGILDELLAYLDDPPDCLSRNDILTCLGAMGPKAVDALPFLRDMLGPGSDPACWDPAVYEAIALIEERESLLAPGACLM